MMSRVKIVAILIFSLMLVIAGCGAKPGTGTGAADRKTPVSSPENGAETGNRGKLNVLVSFYPMYEFAKQVAGDLADVEMLVPAGVEPHDWEPTPQHMKKIAESDVLVYNGAGMEGWIDRVLSTVGSGNRIDVEASKGIEMMEGSGHGHAHHHDDHEHGHDHSHGDHEHGEDADSHTHEAHDDHGETDGHAHEHESDANHSHHDHGGLDPHVWLSPALAAIEVRNIEQALSQAAPEHKDEFAKNADAYVAELERLDQDYRQALSGTKRKDFITQHAAFGYLAKEYGLTQVPIAGLSPDQEPSAEQMAEIVAFAKEHNITTVFFESFVSSKVAEAIASEIGAKTAVLHTIESISEEDRANNADYIGLMRQNLEALQKALNE